MHSWFVFCKLYLKYFNLHFTLVWFYRLYKTFGFLSLPSSWVQNMIKWRLFVESKVGHLDDRFILFSSWSAFILTNHWIKPSSIRMTPNNAMIFLQPLSNHHTFIKSYIQKKSYYIYIHHFNLLNFCVCIFNNVQSTSH